MKKIALFLLVLFVSTSAFAAVAPKPAVVPPTKAANSGMIIGVEGGDPYMRFTMSDSQSADVGLSYVNTNAANNTLGVWGRLNNKIADLGDITTSWGALLSLSTGKQAAADCTIIDLIGSVTADYMISKSVAIYGTINLVSVTSTNVAGAATTSYTALTGSGNAYSGIRVYL